MLLWIAVNAVLGLIIGSFLNVFVIRSRTGASLLGRSGCMSCGATLKSQHLVPLVSWLYMKGKCFACESKVSSQYPIVEATTALLFAFVASLFAPILPHILSLVLVSLWVAIAAYDIRHTIIPDSWAYSAAVIALLVTASYIPIDLWVILAGPVVAAPLFLLWFFSSGRAMGLGDAKLALSIGWLFGPLLGIFSIMYGFIIGALWAVLFLLPRDWYAKLYTQVTKRRLSRLRSRFTMKSEVPFGPFLITGALFVWFITAYGTPNMQDFLLWSFW